MFLYDVTKMVNQDQSIFKKRPILSKLSHSFNDAHWSYPYHVHKDETELIYFSNGKADYQINLEIFHVQKGDLLIVNKGCIHSITSAQDHPISCWTCSMKDFELANENPLFLSVNKKPFIHAGNHEQMIAEIFKELEYFSQSNAQYATTICNELTSALATLYYHIYKSAKNESIVKKANFAQDILFYINENYAQKITIHDLSHHFHISSDHISHTFKEVYGISPINYVIDRRISEAKWMLINTKDSLASISLQVGYENTTHFTNLFIKRVGYRPLEYREKFHRDNTNVYY